MSAESSISYADHRPADPAAASGASTLATIVAFLRRLFRPDRA
jgi:hypothetical protein